MKVWNFGWYDSDLIGVIAHASPIFIFELPVYFKNKSYGRSINEIFYIEECQDPIFENQRGKRFVYDQPTRTIELGIILDYDLVPTMTPIQFSKYLANKYMDRSLDIEEFKFPDFNLEDYLEDLSSFFKEHSLL